MRYLVGDSLGNQLFEVYFKFFKTIFKISTPAYTSFMLNGARLNDWKAV